jgi:uncharacterized membrane protein YeaQ/YmgE (transglycosylase-associated protein family)
MSILLFIVFGLVVGLLAKALLSIRQEAQPCLLGTAGALTGGFVASLLSAQSVHVLHTWGLVGSVVGALIVVSLASLTTRRRSIFA